MIGPKDTKPTHQQMKEMRESIELTKKVLPLFGTHSTDVVGATLATLVATWLAAHRVGPERAADNSSEGHTARVQRLTGFMADVIGQVPGTMRELDEQMAKRAGKQ